MRIMVTIRLAVCLGAVAALMGVPAAQETKPVPKDSVRVSIPGCTKGYVFTAGAHTIEQPASANVPEGMHLRMNGPKKMMGEIKAHEGSMIEITGLIKKGQFRPDGIGLGGGVSISPGGPPTAGSLSPPSPGAGQAQIDLESWRPLASSCPSK
jgi:hypothetical protein